MSMKIGIDFGTTRVVVAAVDRGNFPLVNFETADGQMRDWFPPVAAIRGGDRLYGWDAMAVEDDERWTMLRSLKRWLRTSGPRTEVDVAGQSLPLALLMTETMSALRAQLKERSNLGAEPGERLEAMIGVPANANSNQRFLTVQAAQEAGFAVLGLVNEPSAAAIEFAWRNSAERKSRAGNGLIVYDLGGGTFDVSLVTLGDSEHFVEAADGIPDLGGDDFDAILAGLALETAGVELGLTPVERHRLLEECREKKEGLSPNTRKIAIDLERVRPEWQQVTFPVEAYYDRCRPLIEATREVVENLLAAHEASSIDTLYVTGGGSELPPVARILRESFGRKVRRSAYMRSASAIGLAIRAGAAGNEVHDRLNQNFGLWREADHGGNIVFDLIFPRGVPLPAPGEPLLRVERAYQPAHNIGHFRYIECSRLDERGQPSGEIANWDRIQFPFDPRLHHRADLTAEPIQRLAQPGEVTIREVYTCDSAGRVRAAIASEPSGYTRQYTIGHSAEDQPVAALTAA